MWEKTAKIAQDVSEKIIILLLVFKYSFKHSYFSGKPTRMSA